MRRGSAFLLALASVAFVSPEVFGQYPYWSPPTPAPMPAPYLMPYGYPPPYPAMLPGYAQPAPIMRPWAPPIGIPVPIPVPPPPRVHNFGVLSGTNEFPGAPAPAPVKPVAAPKTQAKVPAGRPKVQPVSAQQDLPTPFGGSVDFLPSPPHSKAEIPFDACGHDCIDGFCGPMCVPHKAHAPHGRGHFIGEVGAYFLVPFSSTRTAFRTSTGGAATETNFPQVTFFGPRASLGYVCHNGWGFRGNYWYLNGEVTKQTANSDPLTTVAAPLAPAFSIASPSTTLNLGIGEDRFNFSQILNVNVADCEFVKETTWANTSLLFSAGARYARFLQTFEGTRTNDGGFIGADSVTRDQQDVVASSRFEAMGPTAAIEFVHPLTRWGLCGFGNVRGSWLFGVERFNQSLQSHRRSTVASVTIFEDSTFETTESDRRMSPAIEAELGLQMGYRLGRCYFFGRGGAVYQKWWDIGSATTIDGGMTFLGGTVMMGITY